MTKKDYIALSNAIKDNTEYSKNGYFVIAKTDFIKDLCDILKTDNPNFNADKFREACK